MRTLCRRPGRLLLAAALLALAAPASAGWWDDAGSAREATLTELRDDPDRWRDVPVQIDVVFDGLTRHRNPSFTQFSPVRWTPVRIRLGGAPTDSRETRFERLFVRRGGTSDARLRDTARGSSVGLRAVVRATVSGEPWIEVLAVTRDTDPLTPEEDAHVRAADRYVAKQNPAAAEPLLRAVLDGRTLARADRAAVTRRLGVALHDLRRPQEALDAFRTALALAPDADARERAAVLERALAAKPAPALPGSSARASRPVPTRPDALRTPLIMPDAKPRLAPPAGLTEPVRPLRPGHPDVSAETPSEDEEQPDPPAPLPPRSDLSGPR